METHHVSAPLDANRYNLLREAVQRRESDGLNAANWEQLLVVERSALYTRVLVRVCDSPDRRYTCPSPSDG